MLAALVRVRSVTARRQLRWIVWGTLLGGGPFAVGYAVPFALGATPSVRMELLAMPLGLVPLAFASAIVRYRLMDVEVIVKRSLVYVAAVSAIAAVYAILLRAGRVGVPAAEPRYNTVVAVLATTVIVLLARPVKDVIQSALDRVFYRDRYDYRRALVGFARDLSTDLDIARLTERLVTRVTETLVVDRMAVMLRDDDSGDYRSAAVARIRGSAAAAGGAVRHRRSRLESGPGGGPRRSADGPPCSPATKSTTGATGGSTTSSRASRSRRRSRCWRSAGRTGPSR